MKIIQKAISNVPGNALSNFLFFSATFNKTNFPFSPLLLIKLHPQAIWKHTILCQTPLSLWFSSLSNLSSPSLYKTFSPEKPCNLTSVSCPFSHLLSKKTSPKSHPVSYTLLFLVNFLSKKNLFLWQLAFQENLSKISPHFLHSHFSGKLSLQEKPHNLTSVSCPLSRLLSKKTSLKSHPVSYTLFFPVNFLSKKNSPSGSLLSKLKNHLTPLKKYLTLSNRIRSSITTCRFSQNIPWQVSTSHCLS